MIQEIGPDRLHIEYEENAPAPGDSLLFFRDGELLVQTANDSLLFPKFTAALPAQRFRYLFSLEQERFFLYIGEADIEIDGYAYVNSSVFRTRLHPKARCFAALTGFHLYKWYRANRFCGGCGELREHDAKERMLRCPKCGSMVYPTISPAVIVGVCDKDRLLMTKYKGKERGGYALIAGFVEIGEMPEDTVRREVMEETGVRVKNIRYYRSQPWGYSNSLLLGFYADLDGSDVITMQEDELGVAEWVDRTSIPTSYDGFSLTNEMICRFKDGKDGR